MTVPPEQLDAEAWSDLERAFFAAAPPEEPDSPEEWAPFDDVPAVSPPPRNVPGRLQRAMHASAATRASVERGCRTAGRVASSVMASIRVRAGTWRKWTPALEARRETLVREIRAGAGRIVAALFAPRPDWRRVLTTIAISIVALVSTAAIVASRSEAPTTALAASGDGAASSARGVTPSAAGGASPAAAAPDQRVHASGEPRSRRSDAPKRALHHHRKPVGLSGRKIMTSPSFAQAGTPQTTRSQAPPLPANRPFFSR